MVGVFMPSIVSAQLADICSDTPQATVCKQAPQTGNTQSNKIYGPNGIFTKGVGIMSVLIGIAAVFVFILGGFKMISAAGNASEIAAARRTILFALVGMGTALFAQAMIRFVLDNL